MKLLKIVLLVIGGIIIMLAIIFGIYLLANRQGIIESSAIGEPDAEKKVLIASQGSGFKNALVSELSAYLKDKHVYLKIVDITSLGDIDESGWDAVIIIHTTEANRLPPDVKAYLDRLDDHKRVILVTTSGSGTWQTDEYDVDIITSASKHEELPDICAHIQGWLDRMLAD